MSYSLPNAEDVATVADVERLDLLPGEAEELTPVIADLVAAANIADVVEPRASIASPANRSVPFYQPDRDEDPLNVFITKCRVEGTSEGPLAGRTIGVKDNISLAGVPTTNGSAAAPYTPLFDAVVVERILGAGGTIVGKLNMDDFGAAGTGETSAFGSPRNPINPAYSPGGSSGGSGAAVRAGEVDIALGVDQGGSGRIPAAFCGVVAVKATHGLVPSFGITHIDHTLDSITPITRTVDDGARCLEVIAGDDWRDPQWVRGELAVGSYADAAADGVAGMSIGVVEESCSPSDCTAPVLEGLQRVIDALEQGGATVSRISLPLWADAFAIFRAYIACLVANMFRSDGVGWGHLGFVDLNVVRGLAHVRTQDPTKIAKQLKCWILCDRYLRENYGNEPYARLQNLRLAVRKQISDALTQVDLLLTPTIPFSAPRLLEGGAAFSTIASRTSNNLPYNTSPLNLSGHPAISIPSGADEQGLPTAVQLVAAHFDDRAGFRAAFELERAIVGAGGASINA
jgi:amidase